MKTDFMLFKKGNPRFYSTRYDSSRCGSSSLNHSVNMYSKMYIKECFVLIQLYWLDIIAIADLDL